MNPTDYLKSQRISKKRAAADLGISYSNFVRITNGIDFPSLEIAIAIYEYSWGLINMDSWIILWGEKNKLRPIVRSARILKLSER